MQRLFVVSPVTDESARTTCGKQGGGVDGQTFGATVVGKMHVRSRREWWTALVAWRTAGRMPLVIGAGVGTFLLVRLLLG